MRYSEVLGISHGARVTLLNVLLRVLGCGETREVSALSKFECDKVPVQMFFLSILHHAKRPFVSHPSETPPSPENSRNALDTSSSSVTVRVLPGPPVFVPLGPSAQIKLV